MTLQEIINRVRMLYPPSSKYGNPDIISMINDAQNRIFRTMYKPQVATVYDLEAGNPAYPAAFSPENIIDVVVNGKEYPYQNIKYAAQPYYYYVLDDYSIGIYPTPTEDITRGLKIYHDKEPVTLNGLNDVPELDSAWHMLIVYYACRECAIIENDDKVSKFIGEINELERQFRRSIQARPHKIQDVYGVGRGAV
jgi:hypothetical protein